MKSAKSCSFLCSRNEVFIKLDLVVLTHEDADHSGGVAGCYYTNARQAVSI